MNKKILYIEPRNEDRRYLYYTYIGKALREHKDIAVTFGTNLFQHDLDKYNLILLGYGACGSEFPDHQLNTKTPIIAFLFKLSNYQESKINFFKKNNIIAYSQHTRIPELEDKYKIKLNPILYPIDTNLFKPHDTNKDHDIGMTGALHNISHYASGAYAAGEKNIRERIVNALKGTDFKKIIQCSDVNQKAYIEDTQEYINTINRCKIWVCTNADHGDLTPRYSEIMSCKTLLFCNEQPYKTFSDTLVDNETCVFFKNNLSDLEEKITYFTRETQERQRIASNGYEKYKANFSSAKFVRNIIGKHT
jgi:hypothetical protein